MKVSLYQEKETPIHKLDPRTKIISSVFLFVCALIFNHPLYLLALFSPLLSILLLFRSYPLIFRLKYVLILLFFFSLILWPFFVKGENILFWIASYPIYEESLYYGMAMGIRLVTFVVIGLIYVSTTKNEETMYGLIALGFPYPFSFAIGTALRLVPSFVDAAVTIMEAQFSRGLELETKNPFKILKILSVLAVPMFVTAIRNTNMLGLSLEARGFSPSARRTFYLDLKMRPKDLITIFSVLSILLFCLYLRVFLGKGVVIPGRI